MGTGVRKEPGCLVEYTGFEVMKVNASKSQRPMVRRGSGHFVTRELQGGEGSRATDEDVRDMSGAEARALRERELAAFVETSGVGGRGIVDPRGYPARDTGSESVNQAARVLSSLPSNHFMSPQRGRGRDVEEAGVSPPRHMRGDKAQQGIHVEEEGMLKTTKPPWHEETVKLKTESRRDDAERPKPVVVKAPRKVSQPAKMGVAWSKKPVPCGRCGTNTSMILTLACGRAVCLCADCAQDFMKFLGIRIRHLRESNSPAPGSFMGSGSSYMSESGGTHSTMMSSPLANRPLAAAKTDFKMPQIHQPRVEKGSWNKSTIPQLEDLQRILPMLNRKAPTSPTSATSPTASPGSLSSHISGPVSPKPPFGAKRASVGVISTAEISSISPYSHGGASPLGKKLSRNTPLKQIVKPSAEDQKHGSEQKHREAFQRPQNMFRKKLRRSGSQASDDEGGQLGEKGEEGYWTEPVKGLKRQESGTSSDLHQRIAGRLRRRSSQTFSKKVRGEASAGKAAILQEQRKVKEGRRVTLPILTKKSGAAVSGGPGDTRPQVCASPRDKGVTPQAERPNNRQEKQRRKHSKRESQTQEVRAQEGGDEEEEAGPEEWGDEGMEELPFELPTWKNESEMLAVAPGEESGGTPRDSGENISNAPQRRRRASKKKRKSQRA